MEHYTSLEIEAFNKVKNFFCPDGILEVETAYTYLSTSVQSHQVGRKDWRGRQVANKFDMEHRYLFGALLRMIPRELHPGQYDSVFAYWFEHSHEFDFMNEWFTSLNEQEQPKIFAAMKTALNEADVPARLALMAFGITYLPHIPAEEFLHKKILKLKSSSLVRQLRPSYAQMPVYIELAKKMMGSGDPIHKELGETIGYGVLTQKMATKSSNSQFNTYNPDGAFFLALDRDFPVDAEKFITLAMSRIKGISFPVDMMQFANFVLSEHRYHAKAATLKDWAWQILKFFSAAELKQIDHPQSIALGSKLYLNIQEPEKRQELLQFMMRSMYAVNIKLFDQNIYYGSESIRNYMKLLKEYSVEEQETLIADLRLYVKDSSANNFITSPTYLDPNIYGFLVRILGEEKMAQLTKQAMSSNFEAKTVGYKGKEEERSPEDLINVMSRGMGLLSMAHKHMPAMTAYLVRTSALCFAHHLLFHPQKEKMQLNIYDECGFPNIEMMPLPLLAQYFPAYGADIRQLQIRLMNAENVRERLGEIIFKMFLGHIPDVHQLTEAMNVKVFDYYEAIAHNQVEHEIDSSIFDVF